MDVDLRVWKIHNDHTSRFNYHQIANETQWDAAGWDDGVNAKPTWTAITAETDDTPDSLLDVAGSPQYTTSNRPSASTGRLGCRIFDTTIDRECYCDGTDWRRMDTDAVVT